MAYQFLVFCLGIQCLSAQVPMGTVAKTVSRPSKSGGLSLVGVPTFDLGTVQSGDFVRTVVRLTNQGAVTYYVKGGDPNGISWGYISVPPEGVAVPPSETVELSILVDPKVFRAHSEVILPVRTSDPESNIIPLSFIGKVEERVMCERAPGAVLGQVDLATGEATPVASLEVEMSLSGDIGKVDHAWLSNPLTPLFIEGVVSTERVWRCRLSVRSFRNNAFPYSGAVQLFVQTHSGDGAFTTVQWMISSKK